MELLITFLAGFSIMAGVFAVRMKSVNEERVEHFSVAMAMASLLALLAFDLGPEVFESAKENNWILIVAMVVVGFVGLVILDGFVPEHEDNEDNHDRGNAHHIGFLAAVGIIVHNIVEGMSIYSLAHAGLKQGVIFAIGVALHNIPMGMLIFTTTRHQSRKEKLSVLGAVSLSTFVGGLVMEALSEHLPASVTAILVSIATGMIIYLVLVELLPHVFKTRDLKMNISGAVLGFLLVLVSTFIE